MYRQLYQMGGIGTLPMDYGKSLQVNNQSQMPIPNYSSAQNITSNPLLNYGQTPLADAGGTPLTMRSGGRMGYQEGGMGMAQDQTMMQPQMQQAPQMDPRQALELIIQMLIAQGIPEEQAREIALQMVQAVAEGGMGEMEDQRIEARFGGRIGYASGGIGSLVDREQYGFGSFFSAPFKAVGSVVKGVTNAVKSVVKSDLGKVALAAAAMYFGGPMLAGATEGTAAGNFLFGAGVPGMDAMSAGSLGIFGQGGMFAPMSGSLLSSALSPSGIIRSLGTNALISGAAGALGGTLAGGVPQKQPGELDADYQNRVNQYKAQYAPLLNPTVQYPNNPFYPQRAANGGRIGYQEGGIGDLVSQVTKQEFFGTPMMASGGRMGYAMGAEVPTRENQAGITELDYRKTGGFVPPVGIKEKADDIPAMLSNNEFVFTANAVRNAGDGDVNQGAKRMYTLMKNLESGGSV
jgi:hypothetical protein